jgi:hypothetical protein
VFFIVWRGNGLVALAALVAMCVPCVAGVGSEYAPVSAMIGGVLGLVGGLLCVRYGRRWNRGVTSHSMYGVPLQGWGYVLLALAALWFVAGSVGLYRVLTGQ